MQTKIEWTATKVPQGIKCPKCKGSGLVIKKSAESTCDLCDGTGIAYKLPGYTYNKWTGCVSKGRGCLHCYAELLSNRWRGDKPSLWGNKAERIIASENYSLQPHKWNEYAKSIGVRLKVFSASMSDVFEDRRDLDVPRAELFKLIEETPWLDWLLLTKRPEKIERLLPDRWCSISGGGAPRNIWFGCTIVNDHEIQTIYPIFESFGRSGFRPAILFLSLEPLVGPMPSIRNYCLDITDGTRPVDQIICGGESGSKADPMHPNWVRDIRDACEETNTPFFFKQWGEWMPYESLTSDMQPKHPHFIDINGKFIENKEDATGAQEIYRMGKGKSGRILDGKTYDGFPDAAIQTT
jgi:protein gp37